MIARHETPTDRTDIWSKLAAPVPQSAISWRQDGRPIQRDGRFLARFVCYIDANTVRERLDSVVPGEWDLTLELLPPLPGSDEQDGGNLCSFKARLQILGVIREDVGTGRDYKSAATDAFKRAAVRFGVGHELYDYEQNWVQVDGDGKYAKPLEDPAAAYERRMQRKAAGEKAADAESADETTPALAVSGSRSRGTAASGAESADVPSCPKCGGRMWDNRLSKRNPKAPDFKCRDRSCDGVIWPPRPERAASARATHVGGPAQPLIPEHDEPGETLATGTDDLPF